jgi:hypothetical protein
MLPHLAVSLKAKSNRDPCAYSHGIGAHCEVLELADQQNVAKLPVRGGFFLRAAFQVFSHPDKELEQRFAEKCCRCECFCIYDEIRAQWNCTQLEHFLFLGTP